MYKKVKIKALEANLKLKEYGLALFTWGNASQLDPGRRFMAIKPSGVRFEDLTADTMCVLRLEDGCVVDGEYNPSTDAPTHLEIYRHFTDVYGIAHTHSTYATAFAQAGRGIPCYGTTHADYFYGEIPCTRGLLPEEIADEYEFNTGRVIVKAYQTLSLDPLAMPGALVRWHGPFAWGGSGPEAAANAAYLEETARLAYLSGQIAQGRMGQAPQAQLEQAPQALLGQAPQALLEPAPQALLEQAPQALLDKHYLRKHGEGAYYGQGK